MNVCLSNVQTDVVRTIQFDDCIQPEKSHVTHGIAERQVDMACVTVGQ